MLNKNLWAKKSEENGRMHWLSLYQHLVDTMMTADLLWEHWLSSHQKQTIINTLSIKSEESAKSLVRFLAAVHDLGKATPAFQTLTGYSNSKDLDDILLERLHVNGFTDISSLRLTAYQRTPHAIASQTLLYDFGVPESVASIVGAHHGKASRETVKEVARSQRAYPANYYQIEQEDHVVNQLWKETQRSYLAWALERCSFESIKDIPSVLLPGQMLLSGLIIMADWIASNPQFFPLQSLDVVDVQDQEARAGYAWRLWNKTQPWEPSPVYSIDTLFERRFGFTPRATQADFLSETLQANNIGILILEAPMGSGKTEAALAAVEILAEKAGCQGVFFGLPTQATSNSMFSRVLAWLNSISSEQHETMSLSLSHGRSALNDEYMALPLFSQIEIDDSYSNNAKNNGSIIVNEWFSGRKKASLDDFVVGTVDQLLMMALNQKHLALRHLGNSRKVMIIDEAHAYEVYMSQYLDRAIEWLGSYQVPLIILSATLPASRRIEMLSAYLKGKGSKVRGIEDSLDSSLADAYPLLTYTDGDNVQQKKISSIADSKIVRIDRIEDDQLLNLAHDLMAQGGILGIIVNTVKRAQEFATVFIDEFGSEIVELLHSSFIASHRINKEKTLISTIGKNGYRPEKQIIIGTQVIEQSLDIDFDVMISDLAPMDLLLQRMGRLHRHDRLRPEKHSKPVCYVLGANKTMEFDRGSEAIYHSFILARTQYYLPDHISIPDDISPLVQKVYGDATLDLPEIYKSSYDEMKRSEDAYLANKKLKAGVFRIDSPTWKDKRLGRTVCLAGWFDDAPNNFSDERANAQVRDTDETIEVIILQKVGEGYGFFGTTENLKNKINDPEVAKKIASQTIALPRVLSAPWAFEKTLKELENYNKLNLKAWTNQVWLKGMLGMILDAEGKCTINGYRLTYNNKIGFTYERSITNESI